MNICATLSSRISLFRTTFLTLCVIWTSSAFAGLSGDVYIDTSMGSAYHHRAGGSGGAIDRGGNTVLCNIGGAHPKEQMCPNDATYTPAAATGGYQAWGVGTAPVNFGYVEQQCFLYLEPAWYGDGWWWIWQVHCEPVVIIFPVGTFGMAVAVVRWGETVGSTTNQISTMPTSVVAFHESVFQPCDPVLPGPCSSTGASSYVADSGYEIKINVDDFLCSPLGPGGDRLGGDSDYDNNCFTYHQSPQTSNLPASYQDTTASDEAAVLTIGWGTADGQAIDPGQTYVVRQFFKSKVQPNMEGWKASHTGAITTEFQTAPTCLAFVGDEWCFFNVDNASVGGEPDEFDYIPVTP